MTARVLKVFLANCAWVGKVWLTQWVLSLLCHSTIWHGHPNKIGKYRMANYLSICCYYAAYVGSGKLHSEISLIRKRRDHLPPCDTWLIMSYLWFCPHKVCEGVGDNNMYTPNLAEDLWTMHRGSTDLMPFTFGGQCMCMFYIHMCILHV